jgi:uncharacterized protein YgiM (DUF1202 family)
MQSHTKFINLFIIVCLISLASIGLAQEAATSPQGSAENAPSFPYVAEITDDNVNIRSGPGTNYYRCGKLNSGDRVKVVASKYSWSHIVPPANSFSWISKQYVSIDPDNPSTGTVTGNSVRVYAGSDILKPIHSTTVQLELNKGDKVKLLGEEMDDYYKIAPPTGAYLWVLSQYAKPIEGVYNIEVAAAPKVQEEPEVKAEPKAKEEPMAETGTETPSVARTIMSVESDKLKRYYALANKIEAERTKPMAEQNYTEIKKSLAEIAEDKRAGKAARYAEFAIKQIGRYELALAVGQAVQFQDSQLQHICEKIENARTVELSQIPDLGRFAVVGQFQTSSIYGQEEELKHYRITDDTGQTVCYALPEGSASQEDLSKFVGQKVGLVGIVEPHPQTKNALVRFTEITELK